MTSRTHDAGAPPLSWSRLQRGAWGAPPTVFVPKRSTPLDAADDGGSIPRAALWCMKYLRHAHLFGRSDNALRQSFGEGDNVVHVIDDGRKNCLISRTVGTGSDGVTYCLVAQLPVASYERLVDGTDPQQVFAESRSFSLCAVFEAPDDAVSNVSVVESFADAAEVPPEYLPPHPPIAFEDSPTS